jgi:type II secretory pathway component GspD/PulD (secretin)
MAMLTNNNLQLLLQQLEKGAKTSTPSSGTTGVNSILVSPRIVAKNHEEATIQIGTSYDYVSAITPVKTTNAKTGASSTGYTAQTSMGTTGLKLSVRPDISADGKYVKLSVSVALTDLLGIDVVTDKDNPMLQTQQPRIMVNSIEANVAIPDSGSVVIALPQTRNDSPGAATQPAAAPEVELILTTKILPPKTR